MVEVLSKANLVSSCNHNQHRFSLFPKWCWSMKLKLAPPLRSNFLGKRMVIKQAQGLPKRVDSSLASMNIQMSYLRIGKAQRWWEKGLEPNMRELSGAQDLVDSLLNAGDKLVVVDFFSPGCGGCKALQPKICQLAGMNPDVQFLQVNYEEHKSMCYSLNVHVLPFFRFYRGAQGRVCSFSCTNATIKKFKDALAKHMPSRCSLAPIKGLEEKELMALAANRDLNFSYTPKPIAPEGIPVPAQQEILAESPVLPRPIAPSTAFKSAKQWQEKKDLVASER